MMRRMLFTAGLASMLAWSGLVGCTKPAVREKPISDPLLTSKKPIEGKPNMGSSSLQAYEMVPPPPPPVEDLAPPPPAETIVRMRGIRPVSPR